MKIQVERLEDAPTSFHFEGDDAWLRARDPEHSLPGQLREPFVFDLQIHRMAEDLYLEGTAGGSLDLECSRCLARYRHELREPFRLVLEPAGDRTPSDPEGAESLARDGVCLGDDAETGWFTGKEIHLGGFFFEVVSLGLPVQPLCRESCPGLCPHCGAELATTRCDCADTRRESPFAVLAGLREDGGRN